MEISYFSISFSVIVRMTGGGGGDGCDCDRGDVGSGRSLLFANEDSIIQSSQLDCLFPNQCVSD